MDKKDLLLAIKEIKIQQANQFEAIKDAIDTLKRQQAEEIEFDDDNNIDFEYDDDDPYDYNNYDDFYEGDSDDYDRESFYALTDGMFGDYEDFDGDWDALDDYLGR